MAVHVTDEKVTVTSADPVSPTNIPPQLRRDSYGTHVSLIVIFCETLTALVVVAVASSDVGTSLATLRYCCPPYPFLAPTTVGYSSNTLRRSYDQPRRSAYMVSRSMDRPTQQLVVSDLDLQSSPCSCSCVGPQRASNCMSKISTPSRSLLEIVQVKTML